MALFELKASGFKPARDIIVFYTGDEETSGEGAELGATKWHDMLDVEYGLNADGGGGEFAYDGQPIGFAVQSAVKTDANYTLPTGKRCGHATKPRVYHANDHTIT